MHGFLKSKRNSTSAQKSHHENHSFFFNRSTVQFLLLIKITIHNFQCLLVLKPEKMSDPLFRNTQDNHDSIEHCSFAKF